MYEDGTEGGPAVFEAEESTERPTDEEVQKAGVQQPACRLLTASMVSIMGQEMPGSGKLACTSVVLALACHAYH